MLSLAVKRLVHTALRGTVTHARRQRHSPLTPPNWLDSQTAACFHEKGNSENNDKGKEDGTVSVLDAPQAAGVYFGRRA